ncbi:MAG: cytochrome c3 family protein [Myxococcales bacterium]|nr:MAG: cytochrome c3 family protein [Myxococcales bacterium]
MQIFPRKLNLLPVIAGIVTVGALVGITLGVWYYFSPKNLQVGYAPEQPVPYSHRVHAGQLGIDCRYCHSSVEVSQEAAIPPTQTCMGCHAIVKADSARLRKLVASWKSGDPMEWVRVHKLPEHSYFDHSVHLAAGVGCASCHGRIDKMEVVEITQPISMSWCLDCHRNPGPHLRPLDQITNMEWEPKPDQANANVASVAPPKHCSGCHR